MFFGTPPPKTGPIIAPCFIFSRHLVSNPPSIRGIGGGPDDSTNESFSRRRPRGLGKPYSRTVSSYGKAGWLRPLCYSEKSLADAICDRIVHSANRIERKVESVRELKGRREGRQEEGWVRKHRRWLNHSLSKEKGLNHAYSSDACFCGAGPAKTDPITLCIAFS